MVSGTIDKLVGLFLSAVERITSQVLTLSHQFNFYQKLKEKSFEVVNIVVFWKIILERVIEMYYLHTSMQVTIN